MPDSSRAHFLIRYSNLATCVVVAFRCMLDGVVPLFGVGPL